MILGELSVSEFSVIKTTFEFRRKCLMGIGGRYPMSIIELTSDFEMCQQIVEIVKISMLSGTITWNVFT